jgi:catechol 2,3-dioxygenase-like lactoylglutathione lyase family enzyme
MLASAQPIAFLPSSDLDRSRGFFCDTLGLVAEEMTPFACVLRASSVMLRVTKVDDLRVQPFTVFGWRVPDIRGSVAQLTSVGVAFVRYDGIDQDVDGIWITPGGDLVAWFKDPDGNTLSLTQFAAR